MKRILKSNLTISLAFFVMTICIFGPLELYITNQAELWFGFRDALLLAGLMSGAAIIVLGGIGLLLRGKFRSLYSALLFIATLCLYVQGNYLNINYGLLDGKTIEWGAYSTHAVVNTLCWIAAVVLFLLLRKKKPQIFKRMTRIVASFVIAVQILTLGVLVVGTDVLMETEGSQLTVDHMTEIGSKDNIVIFVLDTFDDPLMDSFMETDGEYYQSLFADFTRFTDCAASGATTAAAMPIIIGGEYYTDGLSYSDYVNRSFNADGLYSALKERKYNIALYTETAFVGTGADDFVDNYAKGNGTPESYAGLASQYSKFVLFRYMPHILKQYFWCYTAELEAYKSGESYSFDDAAFYQTIAANHLKTAGENSFRLFHLYGAHYPYTINEYAQLDETTTREQQAKGDLYIVEEYINQMKACGVYEDAMIIITSDHGDSANYSAPILFVKDRGVNGTYVENDAPVSHSDLHSTLFSYMGMNVGESFFDIQPDQQRDRLFHLRIQEGGSFYMQEYVISDKVAIVGRGTSTGRTLAPNTEKKPVRLGEYMNLGIEGRANTYVQSGLDSWPLDCMETQGTEVVFNFLLEETQTETLAVSIDVARIYDETKNQSVQVYANGQMCHEETVTGTQTIQFAIPTEFLTDQTLELKLVLATKWCPLYLSGITIGAK